MAPALPHLRTFVEMISAIDHVVLVVRDFERALAFYREVLGCQWLGVEEWRQGRRRFPSLRAGRNMLNVHQAGQAVNPEARNPQPGSEDLCFVWDGPIDTAIERLKEYDVPIEIGPVKRFGARGVEGTSVYFRDPDGNLLELMSYEGGVRGQ